MAELPLLELLDIHEVEETAQALPDWHVSSTQLESGVQETFQRQLAYDDILLMHFQESHAIAHEYRIPPDTTAFCVLTQKSPPQRWCGVEVPYGVCLIHPSDRDYLTCYPAGFQMIGLIVSNDLLDRLEILPEKWLQCREISKRWMVPLNPSGKRFADWLFLVFESSNELRLLAHDPVMSTLFLDQVFEGLANIFAQRFEPKQGPIIGKTFKRYNLTRRAIEVIDEKMSGPLSTIDIANELGVSPRVLQYAFKDVIQASPYEFTLKRKLQAVRHELVSGTGAGATVTEAALKYGFTELGRFSNRYRQMFGELPFKTRKRMLGLSQ